MKKLHKTSLAALLLCVLAFAACGEQKPSEAVSTEAPGQTPETEEIEKAVYIDELPADLDLGGKTYMFAFYGDDYQKRDIGNPEATGEIIEDAVYNRTRSVMERLNFKVDRYNSKADSWGDWATEVSTCIMAGDDVWQIMAMHNNATIQSGISYCYQDLSDMDYLDIDKEYWWKDSIMSLSVNGTEYRYLLGEAMLSDCLAGAAMLFNKDIYASLYGDPNDLYNTALEGKWTIDMLTEMCRDAYSDVNGNGKPDDGDQIGMRFTQYYVEPLRLDYGCVYQRTYRDADNHVVADFDQDMSSSVFEKIYHLMHEIPGSWYSEAYELDGEATRFVNGKCLFYLNSLGSALDPKIRNMTAAWGILPVPKYNEAQKEYRGVFEGIYLCVPITAEDTSSIGAILEGLASESHTNVMETFYSEALMSRYSPDEMSSKCIKLVTDSETLDFALSYSSPLSYLGHELCHQVSDKGKWASSYKSKIKQAQNTLDKYVKNLEDILDQ